MNDINRHDCDHPSTLEESLQAITDLALDRLPGDGTALDQHHDRVVRAVRTGGTDETAWTADRCSGLVWALLVGRPRLPDLATQLVVLGIDADREYLAFRARPDGAGGTRADGRLGGGDGLTVRIGGDLAGFLASPPKQVGDLLVGLGPARTPQRLAESFHLATRALDAIVAFGLHGVHRFDALGLRPAMLADPDVSRALRHRYLHPLAGHDAVPELLCALRNYFACGMRVDRTAERMAVHRNTLRHRIARFETLTGANLRDPMVAMEVWWTLQMTASPTARPTLPAPTPSRRPATVLTG